MERFRHHAKRGVWANMHLQEKQKGRGRGYSEREGKERDGGVICVVMPPSSCMRWLSLSRECLARDRVGRGMSPDGAFSRGTCARDCWLFSWIGGRTVRPRFMIESSHGGS